MVRLGKDTVERLLKEARMAGPDEDPISDWYQDDLSRTDGRMTGQVYTPPIIAFLMARLAMEVIGKGEGRLRVLDPACGCGTFLRALALALGEDQGRLDLVGLEPIALQSNLPLKARRYRPYWPP